MNALFELFRDLILLRKAPQDVPFSQSLLGALILVDFVIGAAVAHAATGGQNPLASVLASALMLSVLLAMPYVVLQLAGKVARFNQTATALVGTDVAFSLLAAPLLFAAQPLPAPGSGPVPAAQMFVHLVLLGVALWLLVVRGHVLRHALEVTLGQGVVISVIFFLLERVMLAAVFPAPPAS